MKVLGIGGDEQKAFWLVLAAIYHLGAAGATKGETVNPPSFPLYQQYSTNHNMQITPRLHFTQYVCPKDKALGRKCSTDIDVSDLS